MKLRFITLLILLAILTSACGKSAVALENPRMAFDIHGAMPATFYTKDQQFNVLADLQNAQKGTLVEAKWYAVNVAGAEAGLIKADTDTSLTIEEDNWKGSVSFSLSNPDGWLPGEYKVELYLNGNLSETVPFTVK